MNIHQFVQGVRDVREKTQRLEAKYLARSDNNDAGLYGNHCSRSVTFWYESGSTDPHLSLTDPEWDPDPALFVSDLHDAT